jgi:hypothetical protein
MAKKNASAKRISSWLTPKSVMEIASAAVDASFAPGLLDARLRGGDLVAMATRGSREDAGSDLKKITDPFPIDASWWEYTNSTGFWTSGDVKFWKQSRVMPDDSSWQVWCHDVRFDPDVIRKMFPLPYPQPTKRSAKRIAPSNGGGRPRKEFWDDLLIAIFRRLYLDNFRPKSQSDVEKAMLSWASQNGHDLSESSVKSPARKLFSLVRDEGKN